MEKLSKQQKAILLWLAQKTREKIEEYGPEDRFPNGVWIDWRQNAFLSGGARNELRDGQGHLSASERASFSRSLKRLEERGLIERSKSNYPGTHTYDIRLTDKGKETVNIPTTDA